MINVYQILRDERMRKKLTIEDASHATKIQRSFLEAIEKGEYHSLPSSTYAEGFVLTYASFLGMRKKEILPLFRREFAAEKHIKVLPEGMTHSRGLSFSKINLHPAIVPMGILLLFVAGFLLFQYRAAFLNPSLSMDAPKANAIVNTDATVSGKADINATVTVNNDLVAMNNDGNFTKHLSLFPGPTVIHVSAKNKFGRESVIDRRVQVK